METILLLIASVVLAFSFTNMAFGLVVATWAYILYLVGGICAVIVPFLWKKDARYPLMLKILLWVIGVGGVIHGITGLFGSGG